MDRKEARTESECEQIESDETKQAEISRIRVLEKPRRLESKTPQGLCRQVQEETQRTHKQKLVSKHGLSDNETQSSDTWMGQLLPDRRYEECAKKNRPAPKDAYENRHMETVEEKSQTDMGT